VAFLLLVVSQQVICKGSKPDIEDDDEFESAPSEVKKSQI